MRRLKWSPVVGWHPLQPICSLASPQRMIRSLWVSFRVKSFMAHVCFSMGATCTCRGMCLSCYLFGSAHAEPRAAKNYSYQLFAYSTPRDWEVQRTHVVFSWPCRLTPGCFAGRVDRQQWPFELLTFWTPLFFQGDNLQKGERSTAAKLNSCIWVN